jgi:glycosyltransferase involved in cell wall biosynthesis
MPSVLHIITGLDSGGAETALARLAAAVDRDRFPQTVLSLTDIGEVGRAIAASGVTVAAAGLGRGGLPGPGGLGRLGRLIAAARPDLVQCWMYHANLLGGLAARWHLGHGVPQVWGVRQTELGRDAVRRRTALVARAGGWLSGRIPAAVVFNAEAARAAHVALGYDAGRARVIPNGFDTEVFRPDTAARGRIRAELGIAADVPLVGLVGRWDPQKDHATFIAAAAAVHRALPAVRFVLAGAGVEPDNATPTRLVAEAGLGGACHLLGHRRDIPALTAALDVACSSSFGEGFANAIGEAMACAVPCAVTAAGDSAAIVADTGRVVPPRQPAALAEAMLDLLRLPANARQALGQQARARVIAEYSIQAMTRRFEALWEEVLERGEVWLNRF